MSPGHGRSRGAHGPESTGKTTLSRQLAASTARPGYPSTLGNTSTGRAPPLSDEDVEPIARGQRAGEDAARRPDACMILDTDLVSTELYARHYYGSCPAWIERGPRRRAHLYLLRHADVPWSADGLQRDRSDRREEMHGSSWPPSRSSRPGWPT